jgi:Cu2+-exporting ATPase
VPAGGRWKVAYQGVARPLCCAGCEAVAETILSSGMADYYTRRDNFPDSPVGRDPLPDAVRSTLSSKVVAESVCTQPAPNQRETVLLLEGLTCSACAWLSESKLRSVAGVTLAEVNYGTRRARVRWNESETDLTAIVDSIESVGYRAWPATAKASAELRKKESRDAFLRLAVAALGMMQVMMYAFPAYIADHADLGADLEALMRGASLLLTVPVIVYSAAPFFQRAWRDAWARKAGMDLPVSLGVLVAFLASVVATFTGGDQVYFDSITMFVFFLLASRFLELRVRHAGARELEYLTRALPMHAHVLHDYPRSMAVATMAAVSLQVGNFVLIRAGEKFPSDGRVVDGSSYADEALLTGEARPQSKNIGAKVLGGSLNLRHQLVMEVERVGDATLLSHIVQLVERSESGRSVAPSMVDRIAGRFILGVLGLAVLTTLFWMYVDPSRAILAAIAVLVVTCPCALSLAGPAVLTAAASSAAREGLLVTRTYALEVLPSVTHVIFDKTGTLTSGSMHVREVKLFSTLDREACLRMAAAMETGSSHPLAQAIVAAAEGPLLSATQVENFPGRGVQALVDGQLLRAGSAEFVAELSGPIAHSPWEGSQVCIGERGRLLACLSLEDHLRTGAADLIAQLRARKLDLRILSGDRQQNVERVGRELGINHTQGGLTPDRKLDAVRQLQREGAVVLMVGDGVNDAPVLAQAQVSIAMGTGAALAQSTADLILLRTDLAGINQAFRLATRTSRIVKQNLWWAVLYNLAAVPLAAAGLVSPWIAGLGMAASSAFVVINALRLAPRLGFGVSRVISPIPEVA